MVAAGSVNILTGTSYFYAQLEISKKWRPHTAHCFQVIVPLPGEAKKTKLKKTIWLFIWKSGWYLSGYTSTLGRYSLITVLHIRLRQREFHIILMHGTTPLNNICLRFPNLLPCLPILCASHSYCVTQKEAIWSIKSIRALRISPSVPFLRLFVISLTIYLPA